MLVALADRGRRDRLRIPGACGHFSLREEWSRLSERLDVGQCFEEVGKGCLTDHRLGIRAAYLLVAVAPTRQNNPLVIR